MERHIVDMFAALPSDKGGRTSDGKLIAQVISYTDIPGNLDVNLKSAFSSWPEGAKGVNAQKRRGAS